MSKELQELLRLKIEVYSFCGVRKDIREEEIERLVNTYKKYIEARNKYVKFKGANK